MTYTKTGPFTNNAAPGISQGFLNNVENHLVDMQEGKVVIDNPAAVAEDDKATWEINGSVKPALTDDALDSSAEPFDFPDGTSYMRVITLNGTPNLQFPGGTGLLRTERYGGPRTIQTFYSDTGTQVWQRISDTTTTWHPWMRIGTSLTDRLLIDTVTLTPEQFTTTEQAVGAVIEPIIGTGLFRRIERPSHCVRSRPVREPSRAPHNTSSSRSVSTTPTRPGERTRWSLRNEPI